MLYDHDDDPGETVNVAESTDRAVVDALSVQLRSVTGTAAQSAPAEEGDS